MIVRIDEQIAIEVSFRPTNRETGIDDDVCFCIRERGPQNMRIFGADETSIQLTPTQAEQMASALTEAVETSGHTPS
jgi:hypothetical protein